MRSSNGIQSVFETIYGYFDHGIINLELVSSKYYWLITNILNSPKARKKVIIGIILYALWAFALLPMGFVKNEFFPKTDGDRIYVSLELPPGTNTNTVTADGLNLIEKLRKTPESLFTVIDIGSSLSTFGSSVDTPNTALATIHLVGKNKRKTPSSQIAESVRNAFKTYETGKVSVTEITSGPPAGSDLAIKLSGDDLGFLDTYADKIQTYLSGIPGVTNIDKSVKPGTSKIVFLPDRQKIAANGVSMDTIGLTLRTFVSGFTLADVKFDKSAKDKENIVLTYGKLTETPEMLGSILIPTSQGTYVPLVSLGTFIPQVNPTTITREGGKRTLTVSASVKNGYNATEINKQLEAFADSLKLPEGYGWKTGGINDENKKSVQSIIQAMILAFILILVTMVVQFQSYRQAFIVLLVIPLAVSSVFVIFAITQTPLSFPALIGILSLFGIVVTNSMFIVDKINRNRKEGMGFKEAIADAGASRLEPIILTKLCTVLGLLPITLADPLWRGLGGAIISGILIASTIMLLFIPAVYYEWFKGEENI